MGLHHLQIWVSELWTAVNHLEIVLKESLPIHFGVALVSSALN